MFVLGFFFWFVVFRCGVGLGFCLFVCFSSAGKTSVIVTISSRDLTESLSYSKACHVLAVSAERGQRLA